MTLRCIHAGFGFVSLLLHLVLGEKLPDHSGGMPQIYSPGENVRYSIGRISGDLGGGILVSPAYYIVFFIEQFAKHTFCPEGFTSSTYF